MSKSHPNKLLSNYMDEVNRHPVLTREEEMATAREYKLTGDQKLADKLVVSNLRFVAKVVYKYAGTGHNMMDMIQEGNHGLIVALKKFDPEKGYRFVTYAVHWIKAYLRKYLINNHSSVKIGTTAAQRNLFFKLRSERAKLLTLSGEVDANELAEILGESIKDIESLESRIAARDFSLQTALADDENSVTHQDMLSLDAPQFDMSESEERSKRIAELVKKLNLNGKEWVVLEKRLKSDDPLTLQEIADQFDISRERVRQIETRLKEKLKEVLIKDGEYIPVGATTDEQSSTS